MKTTSLLFLIAIMGAILVIAAFPSGVWAAASCPNPPDRGRLLILVPRDFENFVYVSEIDGRRTHHRFGKQALDELEAQLRPFFISTAVERVDSEAAAAERLAAGDYD